MNYTEETEAILTDFRNGDYSRVSNVCVTGDVSALFAERDVATEIALAAKKAKEEGYTLERFVSDVIAIGFREGLKPA